MTSRREREILNRIELLERDPKGAKLEEAESTIDKFFSTFPEGARWIKNVHQSGRDNFYTDNIFGGRRHLYGYISASFGVHSAMDRRGPNSNIQGPLSQVGYVAIYKMEQWLDELSTETRLPLIKHIGVFNAVHDSQESEAPILLLPLASYMLEHSATTKIVEYFHSYNFNVPDFMKIVGVSGKMQIHTKNAVPSGIPLNVEFEVDQEIGKDLGHTSKFDGHRRTMISSMEPLARNKRELRQLRENIDIIMTIKEREVARDLRDYQKHGLKPSNRRLLTAEDVLRMHMPEEVKPKKRHQV